MSTESANEPIAAVETADASQGSDTGFTETLDQAQESVFQALNVPDEILGGSGWVRPRQTQEVAFVPEATQPAPTEPPVTEPPATEPPPAPVAAKGPTAPAKASKGDPTVVKLERILTNYEKLMGRRIIPSADIKNGATLLQNATSLIATDPSAAVMEYMLAFHKRHATKLMSENLALRGIDSLAVIWQLRVGAIYTVFRRLTTGRTVALDESEFIKTFANLAGANPHSIIEYYEKMRRRS